MLLAMWLYKGGCLLGTCRGRAAPGHISHVNHVLIKWQHMLFLQSSVGVFDVIVHGRDAHHQCRTETHTNTRGN